MTHRLLAVLIAAAAALLTGCHPRQPAGEASATGEAVGTYRRLDLLVAYYASAPLHDQLQAMKDERDAALARGDHAAARDLERQGEALQEKAHRQLTGDEPLDNVMAALEGAIPQVKQELGVTRLVEDTQKLPKGTRTIDATEALTKHLPRSPRVPANPKPSSR